MIKIRNNIIMHDGTGVDELQWREAMQRAGGEGNAKNLWPVLALGTRDLLARKQAQVLHPSQTHSNHPEMAADASRQEVLWGTHSLENHLYWQHSTHLRRHGIVTG